MRRLFCGLDGTQNNVISFVNQLKTNYLYNIHFISCPPWGDKFVPFGGIYHGLGIGGLALGSLLDPFNFGKETNPFASLNNNSLNLPHFAPKAKRIIYLFQSGGPSQLDLFDYKPKLNQLRGT